MTEQMIDAAIRELPGVWNRARVRRALTGAFALIPDGSDIEVPVNVRLRLQVDEAQLRTDTAEALKPYQDESEQPPFYLLPQFIALSDDQRAEFEATLAEAAAGPMQILHSPQPTMTVTEPVLNPALERPIELGSQTHIARRLNVARSTVSGWIKNRETNGMPGPVDGLAYDLRAIEAWHRQWKATD